MEQIRFVSALEGAFEYDRTLKMDSGEVRGAMGLGVGATLLLSETKDVVGMIFSMVLKYQEKVALRYSVVLTFKVTGWTDSTADEKEENLKNRKEVLQMLEITVGFLRGSLYVHTKNSPLEGLTLPILSLEQLLQNMKVVKTDTVA